MVNSEVTETLFSHLATTKDGEKGCVISLKNKLKKNKNSLPKADQGLLTNSKFL